MKGLLTGSRVVGSFCSPRMSGGRATRGPLYQLMRERLGVLEDLDLCRHVYVALRGDRALIAQIVPAGGRGRIAG